MPEHDITVGISGGVNFGEKARAAHRGPSLGVSLGYHHDFLGVQLEVGGRREGMTSQVGGSVDIMFWYLALVGGGVTYWKSLSTSHSDIPATAWGVSGFVGIPIPLARLGSGALVLVPYARPGLRFAATDNVQGHHEAGLRLSWSTFDF